MTSILSEAEAIIYGDREATYGEPGKNLETIANLWEEYLRARGLFNMNSDGLQPTDVALMMVLLKVARLTNDPQHHDSMVDICGYTALIERIQSGV